jgi:tetratricopeptide (TPR) repeat protein
VNQEAKHLSVEQIECLTEIQPRALGEIVPSALLEEAHRHLAICEACQRLVSMRKESDRMLRLLRENGRADTTSECPPQQSLNELAAGVLNTEQAEKLLNHVVQCDHCGPLLRDATHIFSDEAIADEELKLAELRSGQADWQKNLVGRLSPAFRDSQRSRVGFGWWEVASWPRWVFATVGLASMLLLLAGSAFWLRTRRSELAEANQLVVQSYAEHRTIRPRFPEAHHTSAVELRGGEQRPFSETPRALRKAETMIARGLEASPNDPNWLQLKARADLLEGDPGPAVASLESALEKKPRDSSIEVDLASAYFEASDYERAVNLLTEVLRSEPDNSIALFNRAIALESQHKYREAIADWTRYLELDPAGEWSSEARQHLENAKALVHGN